MPNTGYKQLGREIKRNNKHKTKVCAKSKS